MLMEPTRETLVARCRAGDRDAFGVLVNQYGLQVLRTARLILRDPLLAEDVTQETFIKAWRQIGSLRGDDPGPWLNRIAANESISAYRRRHRFDALVAAAGRLAPRKVPVPDEARIDLATALGRLDARSRAVVVLHYYRELTVEETAATLGLSVDAVKSRLKVALRRLRELAGSLEENT
jgi:RNA polymerase sigma-70 factor (ECF subfamily)